MPRRLALAVLVSSSPVAADPAPCQPTEADPDPVCWNGVSTRGVRHVLEAAYGAGLTGFTDGSTSAVVVSTSGDLGYQATLVNDEDQPAFDIATGAGLTLGRMQGTVSANQLTSHAYLRLGPSVVPATDDRGNMAVFPLTFELEHDGELGAIPRLSGRPDANRGVFDRERVALSTRLVRIEVGGETQTQRGTRPPGDTKPIERTSAAIDVITFFGDAEATVQDGSRIEASLGGALMSVTSRHVHHGRVDLLALEHRAIWLPDGSTLAIPTVWMLKAMFDNPATGSTYTIGWGVVAGGPYDTLATPTAEDPHPDLTIGGIGWWSERRWGGVGFQYERRPYATMLGEPALDDRAWVEAWRAGKLELRARAFVARTRRFSDEIWSSDVSSGVEFAARRELHGIDVGLTFEAGQTYYAQLDDGRPELGFAARGGLSLRRTGRRAWTR